MAGRQRPRRSASRRLRDRTVCSGRWNCPVDLAPSSTRLGAERTAQGQGKNTRPRRPPASSPMFRTGEIVAIVSLPDFDPNNPREEPHDPDRINRLDDRRPTRWGSTFKALTLAMALDFRQGESRHHGSMPAGALHLRQIRHSRYATRWGRSISAWSEVFHIFLECSARRGIGAGARASRRTRHFLRKMGAARSAADRTARKARSPIVPKALDANSTTITIRLRSRAFGRARCRR